MQDDLPITDGTTAGAATPLDKGSRSDDRVWAALAHGSGLFMLFGPVVPVVLWFTQRKKSAYVAFQSLQALAYQTLFFWSWFTVVPAIMIVVLIVFVVILVRAGASANAPYLMILPQIAMLAVMIGFFALYGLVALIAAVASLMGRDFKYPLLGGRLARFLEYQGPDGTQLSEAKEDRIVAAASHSTLLVPFVGLLTPIAVWITQHERSNFLRFQAMQAIIYQALGLVAYMLLLVLDIVFTLLMVAGLGATDFSSRSTSGPTLLLLLTLPLTCVLCIVALGVPLYHLFGFLGSLSTLRGHDFHYPILGSLLAARLNRGEYK